MKYPHYHQHDQMDCGPTCLRMVAKFHGRIFNLPYLRQLCEINRAGVSLYGIAQAAEKIGLNSSALKVDLEALNTLTLPCIVHWNQNHFVVLYKIDKGMYLVGDPAKQLILYTRDEFMAGWLSDKDSRIGIVLTLHPQPFFSQGDEPGKKSNWALLLSYAGAYKKLLIQLILGLFAGAILQLVTPFLTQSIVDVGINTKNLNFIYIILFAQGMIFLGTMSVNILRSWIILHITTRINVSLLTDFLAKLMRLPLDFFDSHMNGDILQRIQDQKRVESFLTGPALNTLFSLINIVVFSIAVSYYDLKILFIFLFSTALYAGWILLFMRKRRELDVMRFDSLSSNQSNIIELITGIQEIKLHNIEQQKRWEWERIQARLFKFNVRSLAINQYQQSGSSFINQGKNIVISFISATAVMNGELTLGGMLAIQFIVGQLNSPIEQLLSLIQGFQDTKISLERLSEVHEMTDEEPANKDFYKSIPSDRSIHINGLKFTYPGAGNEPVLHNINLEIPQGKTTAIVGMSGSGKTTLLKLLLRFYSPQGGEIKIGNAPLNQISFRAWRDQCGMVLQDGYIFSDTIASNIAMGDQSPDLDRLDYAATMANIKDFISDLPLGYKTKIGSSGNGISQGQRQRILIARTIYKNPHYVLFDEATNALDANNESKILDNMDTFLKGKTVVVVAHRLSTVKNADRIVVLDRGRIVEQGTHADLTNIKGAYYNLVKNQLELGS